MQRQTPSLQSGPKDLLKSNLHSFLSCVDSLAALHQCLETDKLSAGWPFTRKLDAQVFCCRFFESRILGTKLVFCSEQIQECQKQADSLFSEVLGRKDRADGTRSALSVLQRFRFLFFLPSSIRRNVEKVTFRLKDVTVRTVLRRSHFTLYALYEFYQTIFSTEVHWKLWYIARV